MSERDRLLSALIKEVLGPQKGPNEVLSAIQDPRSEYVTGILAPRDAQPAADVEADAELLEEEGETEGEEDLADPSVVAMPAISFSPALNPKTLPHSMGLSFLVEASSVIPEIEICVTWARYVHPSSSSNWRREPACFLTGRIRADRDHRWRCGAGVDLLLRSRIVPGSSGHRLSLYLVNMTQPHDAEHIATEELVFQPQIRVHCPDGTQTKPSPGGLAGPQPGRPQEDESLALLYRERRPLARGHLCGATWKDIDPERGTSDGTTLLDPPYVWVDAGSVPAGEASKFSPAGVRTEFVPCYPVEAPEMDWRRDEFPVPPDLDPERLAEIWEPSDVHAALDPLVDSYMSWIVAREQEVGVLDRSLGAVADRHLADCRSALERMREGIRLVAGDDDVRLAFCFSNRAIAMQSRWARRGIVIHWRPFQLGFILLNIPGIAMLDHPDRQVCDLLWFPTGGGKTEAYLALAAFALALRRRRSPSDSEGHPTGAGVGVISRYTLRLLTIQQFRRALGVVTACEQLRVWGLGSPETAIGWRPVGCQESADYLWGTARFSAGLWVGGNVTPNSLHTLQYKDANGQLVRQPGAFDLLTGAAASGPTAAEAPGEPAQVTACPACRAVLAVPTEGFPRGSHELHLVLTGAGSVSAPATTALSFPGVQVRNVAALPTGSPDGCTLSINFDVVQDRLSAEQLDQWWMRVIEPALRQSGGSSVELACARPSRPGYFLRYYTNLQGRQQPCDFDVFCPNPDCDLNRSQWSEKVPIRVSSSNVPAGGYQWQHVPEPFRVAAATERSSRIPIPASTVDDQIYHRCPSLVVATVDKFARLSFEPKAGALFGSVERYHARWGYYRAGCPPSWGGLPDHYREDPPGRDGRTPLHRGVLPFEPPDLILQDELHLIEGPLGSMVGLFETMVDLLARRNDGDRYYGPKYVASTATVRQATSQVQALFSRALAQFPPPGLTVDDSFFARTRESHPSDALRAGRLYVAIAAPGRGAQTPIIRIWSALLQTVFERRQAGASVEELDRFWTLVGYFNAIRELAGARALYRQDIPEWIRYRATLQGATVRSLSSNRDRPLELSSRADSLKLPTLLELLTVTSQSADAEDAVLATSMFGTGVDVDRLGLMVVHGQPKATAAYIQATGRVGRNGGGLVIAFLRASRPRDLDHYEFFTGYHRALYGYVEPVTVAPFSPRARERGMGPLMVALVRQAAVISGHPVPPDLRLQQRLSASATYHSGASHLDAYWHRPEIQALAGLLEARALTQPDGRRPQPGVTHSEAASELDIWRSMAQRFPGWGTLLFSESSLVRTATHPVILGDPHHQHAGLETAFQNAPNSLREVEATTRFKG